MNTIQLHVYSMCVWQERQKRRKKRTFGESTHTFRAQEKGAFAHAIYTQCKLEVVVVD